MNRPVWWHPDNLAARRAHLEARGHILAAVRGYFAAAGFAEVETPALQVSPGVEPHLRAVAATLHEPFGGESRLYLHTSPELTMKKLLAAGLPRIYQLAHTYRDGERSELHHPEFAMLEWYRAGAGTEEIIADAVAVVRAAAQAAGGPFRRGAAVCDPHGEWERISVADAFARHADIDVLGTIAEPRDLDPDAGAIKAEAKRIGVATSESDRFEDVFFKILLARIEPQLGRTRPAILSGYPLCLGMLAKESADDPRTADRFEIYVCGVELANGCAELTDAAEHRRRFAHFTALRERLYGGSYPADADFLAAVESGLPACSGIALGFDRLVMLATGAQTIEEVMWAPVAGGPKP